MNNPIDPKLAREVKAIVALAFRNGPIEDVHAGKACPVCEDKPEYSGITEAEMKEIMRNAVNQMYRLYWLKENDPRAYEVQIELGQLYTARWDDPTWTGSAQDPAE